PGRATAEQLHVQGAIGEIRQVEVGDLQLAARGGFEGGRAVRGRVVIEVQSGHRMVGAGTGRLFLDPDHAAVAVELRHAVTLRVAYVVAEDGGALRALVGCTQRRREAM